MTKTTFAAILLQLLSVHQMYAQNTDTELAVRQENKAPDNFILSQISNGKRDTAEARLLLKVARMYWWQRTTANHLIDSCIYFAQSANDLSRSLAFTEGTNEATFLICKAYTVKRDIATAKQVSESVYGEQKVKLLLVIAEYYVFQVEPGTRQLEKALPYIMEAKDLAHSIHSNRWEFECMALLAKYYFKQGDIRKGSNTLMTVISSLTEIKRYSEAARYWSILGDNLPENKDTYPEKKHAYEKTVESYLLAGNKLKAAYTLRDLAVLNCNYNNVDTGGKQLQQMLELFRQTNEKLTIATNFILADYYRFMGQYDKALFYAHEAIKLEGPANKKILSYYVLARTYSAIKDYVNADYNYKIVFDYLEARGMQEMYVAAFELAENKSKSGKGHEAIHFLNDFIKAHPPKLILEQELFALAFGQAYSSLGDLKNAEQYYNEMIRLESIVYRENGKDFRNAIRPMKTTVLYSLGKFYLQKENFSKAREYLQASLVNPEYFDAEYIADSYRLLSKADSSLGNLKAAMAYLERYHMMIDSMNSVAVNRQIADLNIRYETEQKVKDIKLLREQQKLQQAELQRSSVIKNVFVAGAGVFLLLATIAYLAFRNKRKSNRQLTVQQKEINDKNKLLETLLQEKEWMLKEVHHRVRNNLQIVMSLLDTHSEYLKNEDLKQAMTESQNRVGAIAIIHQKLYTGHHTVNLNLPEYVTGLIALLTNAFETRKRNINFQLSIDEIDIDSSQAVPVGLILNELITNAIKYAFTNSGGSVSVELCKEGESNIRLTVADNGKGFPADFDFNKVRSFGMSLVRGLTKQLGGDMIIENHAGAKVSVQFS